MKKQEYFALARLLLVPVLLILLGLILIVNPDSASALISRLVGYVLTLAAVCTGLAAVFSSFGKIKKAVAAVVLAIVGGWLMAHPLWLTAWVSRLLGMLIMAALAVLGTATLLTPIHILLYQLVWCIPGVIVTFWTRAI